MDHLVFVENAIKHNIFIYDIDIEDGDFVGELARRSIETYENNINLLRYNNHICYLDDINTFFKRFRCPNCDTFIKRAGNFHRHVKSCKDRIQHIYPKSVYTLRETLFDKLDGFGIGYEEEQKLFKNLAVFDFESICVPSNELKDTNTTTWIGKHEPISVSISSNLLQEPIFLCNRDPKTLIVSFVEALEELASRSKAEMLQKFSSIENAIKNRVSSIFEKLNGRKDESTPMFEFQYIEKEEIDMSTQFLQIQKNQLLEQQQHFERYVSILPVFGFNSGKYDLNIIKSYLLPYLIHERDIQPTVIKKANHFVSFNFGDVQFLDILNFLGGATSLDSFLKAYKTNETKGFFPYEWFDSPNKLDVTFLPPYECFFSKLRDHNPLEKELTDFTKLLNSGLSQQEAPKKLRLKVVPPSGFDNYNYLESVWEHEQMTTFQDFVRWYNNKDVVPTLEAMQKMMEFYHNKGIDMLKLGCTLPNLANICLHKSTNSKFYPFVEADKDLHDKIREDMTGGPSIVFTRKAIVDQTYIRNTENICKSIVGIDASQLYPFSMCQEMPTGLYTRWEFDSDSQKFKARQNKSRKFENMVMSYLQSQRPNCTIESYYTTGTQKKIDCFNVDGFCAHCKTIFEAMGCYFHFCACQEARASMSEEETQKGLKKREYDELRRDYLRNKGYKVVEIWECNWWETVKGDESVKIHVRNNFPFKLPLTQESLLTKIREDKLFGYVQCDLEVPDGLKYKFSNFPPIFRNFNVSRADIGYYMRDYAIDNDLLKQPQRMLISSFKLENGTVITQLLNFYLSLGLKCTKIYRFVQYTPKKCLNNFVQSVVDARRVGDENPESSVVAETMKLLGNSSYGYQIIDRSRHTETKYLNDEKTHKAINGKLFKRLNSVSKELYEVELVKSKIEHREPIIVGFLYFSTQNYVCWSFITIFLINFAMSTRSKS